MAGRIKEKGADKDLNHYLAKVVHKTFASNEKSTNVR